MCIGSHVLRKMRYKLELHVRKTDLPQKLARSPAFLQKHSTTQKQKQSQREPMLRLNHVWGLVVAENEGSRAKKKEIQKASAIRGMKEEKEKAERGGQKQIIKHGEEYYGKAEKFVRGKKNR